METEDFKLAPAMDAGEDASEVKGDDIVTEFERFDLPLLEMVRSEHLSNDIKNGSYVRYHRHCSNKLRRLRKNLKLAHGRGKTFQKKPLTVELAQKDPRHLVLLLFSAERAWSNAMVIKEDRRRRRYIGRRFMKAAKLAERLAEFSRELGEDKTTLEADAYSSWMSAISLLERERLEESLESFKKAQLLFEGLATAFGAQSTLYRERLEELEPSIAFCRYSIARQKGEDPTSMMNAASPRVDNLVAAKIDAALSESRKVQAESFGSVDWCGRNIPIRTEKVGEGILLAREAVHTMEQESDFDKKAALYDKIFIAYNDVSRTVSKQRSEITAAAEKETLSQIAEQHLQELDLISQYIKHSRLRQTIARNLLLVEKHIEANSKPDDLVRLYENLRQNCQEILDLDGILSDPKSRDMTQAEIRKFEASRCFWLAKSYKSQHRWSESILLFKRAEVLLNDAYAEGESVGDPKKSDLAEMVKESIRLRAMAHAQGVLENLKLDKSFKEGMQLTETGRKRTVLSGDERFESVIRVISDKDIAGTICEMPPSLTSTPCKPVAFDIAVDGVTVSDVKGVVKYLSETDGNDGSAPKREGTGFSRWFRG
ncbi:hypothetical protein NDN08_006943 [Rhodosorus marinus]|uniref:Signal recognition particle subunit SRP68 n=1 Tax=Rhodosorus marinus TaxID=101924 RepID=A0AAV8UJ28_9RHOD|nr:hypothetical protein NDN08_006943 [Rhodosorus marinus]